MFVFIMYSAIKKAIRNSESSTTLPTIAILKAYLRNPRYYPLPSLIHFFKLQFKQQYTQGYLPTMFDSNWINANVHNASGLRAVALCSRKQRTIVFTLVQINNTR